LATRLEQLAEELPPGLSEDGKTVSKGELPRSRVVGEMIELPTPCGRHVVYYPLMVGQLAVQHQQYSVFHTTCECGTAYLVATQPDGAHFRLGGSPEWIIERYESISWKEERLIDRNGVFHFKRAPSLAVLLEQFAAS
jgi:hypothetical protein